MMKNQRWCYAFLLLAFVLFSHRPISARPLSLSVAQIQVGKEAKKADGIALTIPLNGGKEDVVNLMGSESSEGCKEDDAGCLNRRMMAEAHLDYIYTQHQNNP